MLDKRNVVDIWTNLIMTISFRNRHFFISKDFGHIHKVSLFSQKHTELNLWENSSLKVGFSGHFPWAFLCFLKFPRTLILILQRVQSKPSISKSTISKRSEKFTLNITRHIHHFNRYTSATGSSILKIRHSESHDGLPRNFLDSGQEFISFVEWIPLRHSFQTLENQKFECTKPWKQGWWWARRRELWSGTEWSFWRNEVYPCQRESQNLFLNHPNKEQKFRGTAIGCEKGNTQHEICCLWQDVNQMKSVSVSDDRQYHLRG
jgi:hypothetical protein